MISESIIQGQRVRLRPVVEGDLPHFVRWLNDPEVRHFLSISEDPPLTLESEREWYEETRASSDSVHWAIETAEGRLLGSVELRLGDHGTRAELGIAIQDKAFWGRGYGTEAIQEVLRYAFGEMGLRRVSLVTDEDNLRAIRSYEKCGFRREGLLRAHRLRGGQPVNGLVMAILREEFQEQPWR